jgi:hypothetical protein
MSPRGVPFCVMHRKPLRPLIGAAAVIVLLSFQAVEHWTVIEHTLEALKSQGAAGVFIARVLTSTILPLVLAILTIGMAVEMWRERPEKDSEDEVALKSLAQVEHSGNSSATATGNKIEQNFNFGPMRPIVEAKPQTSVSPVTPPKERKIEITALAPTVKWIKLHEAAEKWTFSTSRERDGGTALLLPFYFDPIVSDPVYSIEYVRAHLIFTDVTGGKTLVDHGCWVGYTLDFVEMRPGETRHLLIVLIDNDTPQFAAVNTNRTNGNMHMDREAFDLIPLPPNICRLEAVLLWGGGGQFKRVFQFNPFDLLEFGKQLPT